MLSRFAPRAPDRIACRNPATVRAFLLTAAISACSPTPESATPPADAGSSSDPDALWIAVKQRSGFLVPVARYLEGSWDNAPWAGIFTEYEFEARRIGDGVWGWPDASRLWDHPGRVLDTLGRTPDLIATGVPSSWHLYSQSEQGVPVSTTGLVVVAANCEQRWAIKTNQDSLPDPGNGTFDYLPGIALTQVPTAVLSEDDIPALDRIREALDLADVSEDPSPESPFPKTNRSYRWLGFFRFDGGALGETTLGVLYGRYYEGAEYIVIQIDGDRGRVILRTSEGGC